MDDTGAPSGGVGGGGGDDIRQMVFDFPARPALGRADFLVAPCNATAVTWIDRWPDWPGAALALVGPEGCGKTHLAHVLASRTGAIIQELPDVASLNGALTDGLFTDAAPRVVVVEMPPGAPMLGPEREETLFHLLNVAREQGGHVLLTAEVPPARWPVALRDLQSRLTAIPMAEITPPDAELLEMVLIKLFADRQVVVSPEVIRYLTRRMERSFAAARDIVARLDTLALSRSQPITLPLARTLLTGNDPGPLLS
ncbi:hypothetical protein GHC57_09580 [Roseospira navarrensis]|uniref:Hda lid domain-containing protein n=2 Tax=Roseospira navarrensis TaxID=140058 RepID=A0A7X1ZFS0_9PROT|nr:hypothetical protein [Roseospira navarrensis]